MFLNFEKNKKSASNPVPKSKSINHCLFILLLFAFSIARSQSVLIEGTVSDTINKPLEFANVVAKPKENTATLRFATADASGNYNLQLQPGISYEIFVSYIGYLSQSLLFESGSAVVRQDFRLVPTGEVLNEVIIKHEPIIVKTDTLIFDVKSFASGNEFKMKEILEKLPGVEVDRNGNVTVQGKRVTQMLVEGKSFFGGGSKLAVENIPADALEKVEVIDNFNEVGFMKEVSDSKELAMNVKLREGKKKFVFGDLEAGSGPPSRYVGHSALFYYSPKTNIGFIGDLNNAGRSSFSYDDLQRLEGGSTFLKRRPTGISLFPYTIENKDLARMRSQFAAVNFSVETNEKLTLSGFGIFSKMFTGERQDAFNQYLQNGPPAIESQVSATDNNALLGMGNFKLEYKPSKNESLSYNARFQSSHYDLDNTITSIAGGNSTAFKTLANADNVAFNQYLEWHRKQNEKHTIIFVADHSYNSQRPENLWVTSSGFLAGLIPLETAADYRIEQLKYVKNNTLDVLFRHYWILNKGNHIYTTVGNTNTNSGFRTTERQLLGESNVNDFADAGFGNNLDYRLNDAYMMLEYKFRIGKWTNKPGISFHWYSLKTNQHNVANQLDKGLFEPRWLSEYEFSNGSRLELNYALTNTFSDPMQMADSYTLQSYNSVFRGNPNLENERFHAASMTYRKFGFASGGWNINTSLSINRKVRTLRNEVFLQGIDQFNMPVLYANPETKLGLNGSVSRKVGRFRLGVNGSSNWFTYIQTLNDLAVENTRRNQSFGVDFRTAFRKWPDFSIRYTKHLSQFVGISDENFQADAIHAYLKWTVLKDWHIAASHEFLSNRNQSGQRNNYSLTNASLDYQEKNSRWRFSLSLNNLLNNHRRLSYSFSDYVISEKAVAVLPRMAIVSIYFKI